MEIEPYKIISETFIKKIFEKSLDASLEWTKKHLPFRSQKNKTENKNYVKLLSSTEEIRNSLESHCVRTFNWSAEIKFRELSKSKNVDRVFVDLDLDFAGFGRNSNPKMKLIDILNSSYSHLIILGNPGAGKTTSMKYLCNSLLIRQTINDDFKYPLVIRLRELNPDISIPDNKFLGLFDTIQNILGLNFEFGSNVPSYQAFEFKTRIIIETLEELGVLLIIDGFDELANQEYKRAILSEYSQLSLALVKCKLIITSRTADFRYTIENNNCYEICPLSDSQIIEFTSKWIPDPLKAAALQNQIFHSPFYDTTMRPLTLAHLCAIYERWGEIPEKPKTVYKKVVSLLIESWDNERSIERVSKLSNFAPDRKFEFLSNLAFEVTAHLSNTIFSIQNLKSIYRVIHVEYGLPENELQLVLKEIEIHSGLFINVDLDHYEFAHKSIQEYLTAEYLVRLPSMDAVPSESFIKMPNEFALSTALSANSSLYLFTLIFSYPDITLETNFLNVFLSRLLAEKPDLDSSVRTSISILYLYKIQKFEFHDISKIQNIRTDNEINFVYEILKQICTNNSVKLSFKNLRNQYIIIDKKTIFGRRNSKYRNFAESFNLEILERQDLRLNSPKLGIPDHLVLNEFFRELMYY